MTKKTVYLMTIEHLLQESGENMEQAIHAALPDLDPDIISKGIRNGGTMSLEITTALADHFSVGISEFLPNQYLEDVKNRIYLAGPITGCPDFMDRFADAESYLTNKGLVVFNPAKITASMPKASMNRKEFMDLGIFTLSMCRQLALLPGWASHNGCKMELAYAETNSYQIYYLTDYDLMEGRYLRTAKGVNTDV